MSVWKRGWVVVAFVGAAGAAVGASVQSGQTRDVRVPRALEVIVGGSRLGVAVREIDEADGKRTGAARGVVVEEVTADSPAGKAGVRKGDVIVAFDGESVRSVRQLTRLVQETPAGRTVEATLLRDGQQTTVSVTPAERFNVDPFEHLGEWGRELRSRIAPRAPAVPPAPGAPVRPFRNGRGVRGAGALGMTVSPLSGQLAEYFGAGAGVLVTEVNAESAAAKAGLRAGDVITALNGEPVTAPADVRRRVQRLADGEEFTLSVMRERKAVALQGKVERPARRRSLKSTI